MIRPAARYTQSTQSVYGTKYLRGHQKLRFVKKKEKYIIELKENVN